MRIVRIERSAPLGRQFPVPRATYVSPDRELVLLFTEGSERSNGRFVFDEVRIEPFEGGPALVLRDGFEALEPYEPWAPGGDAVVLAPTGAELAVHGTDGSRTSLGWYANSARWSPGSDRILVTDVAGVGMVDRSGTTLWRSERLRPPAWASGWWVQPGQCAIVALHHSDAPTELIALDSCGRQTGRLALVADELVPIDPLLRSLVLERNVDLRITDHGTFGPAVRCLHDVAIVPDECGLVLRVAVRRPLDDVVHDGIWGRYVDAELVWVTVNLAL